MYLGILTYALQLYTSYYHIHPFCFLSLTLQEDFSFTTYFLPPCPTLAGFFQEICLAMVSFSLITADSYLLTTGTKTNMKRNLQRILRSTTYLSPITSPTDKTDLKFRFGKLYFPSRSLPLLLYV